jgi:hypothetical protein
MFGRYAPENPNVSAITERAAAKRNLLARRKLKLLEGHSQRYLKRSAYRFAVVPKGLDEMCPTYARSLSCHSSNILIENEILGGG